MRDGYYDQHRHWHPATPLLADDSRTLPETVPQEYLATHPEACGCDPCARMPKHLLRRWKRAVRG